MKSLERSYNLFMQTPAVIGILSYPGFTIELANEGLLEIWDRSAEVIGKPLFEAIPELNGQGFKELLEEVCTTGKPFYAYDRPLQLVRNGSEETVYMDFVYKPWYEDKQAAPVGVFALGHDVTEKVLAQRKAQEVQADIEKQKRLYDAISGNTPDLIYVFDLNYKFTYANKALLNMWGKTWDEAIGKGLPENGYEQWHTDMHHREIDQVVATKQPIRGEVSFPHAELGRRIYDYIFVPVIGEDGRVEAVAGTTRDITEIRKAEEVLRQNHEMLEALVAERTKELQRSNKELEAFAYAASHDMKEPLRKISFYADCLRERCFNKLEPGDQRYFTKLDASTKRMTTLIDELLVYSHVNAGITVQEPVDLNEVVSNVLEDMELIIDQTSASLNIGKLPVLHGNSRQLQQLFHNLIGNALKYHKPGQSPVVHVSSKTVVSTDVPSNIMVKEGRYHLIEIKDQGIGFSQQYAGKIFDVFTRLHGSGDYSGTGIGLSIALKVVQNHSGYIWANSAEGEGATFNVLFPVTPAT